MVSPIGKFRSFDFAEGLQDNTPVSTTSYSAEKKVRISPSWPAHPILLARNSGVSESSRLIQQLQNPDWEKRWEAAWRLYVGYHGGGPEAFEPLMQLLDDKQHSLCRRWAVAALGDMGNPLAANRLILMLGDEDVEARRNAALALGDIGDQKAIVPLTPLLKAANPRVKKAAAISLGRLGFSGAFDDLVLTLQEKDDEGFLTKILSALGRLRNPKAVPHIIPYLQNNSLNVQYEAAKAMAQIGDEKAINALKELLGDKTPDLRAKAALFLSEIGDPTAVDSITSLLKDNNRCELLWSKGEGKPVHQYAAEALIKIGDPKAAEVLRKHGGEEEVIALYKSAAERARKNKNLRDAIVYYEKLMQMKPKNYVYPLNLARCYQELGQINPAEEHYQKSLMLCPDCDGLAAQRALADLKDKKKTLFLKTTFIGVSSHYDIVESGFLTTFDNFVFQALRNIKINVLRPNIGLEFHPEKFTKNGEPCSEAACTAQIAGALGHSVGVYGTVEKIEATDEIMITLFYVNASSTAVTHQAMIKIPKKGFVSAEDARKTAEELALEMAKTLLETPSSS